MHIYNDRDDINMVASGYADKRDDNRNSGYCSGGYHDRGKTTQVWQHRTRELEPATSIEDKLSGPCNVHFYIDKHDGKKSRATS